MMIVPAPAVTSVAPIFIVGAGRSGTTLLRLMLNAHSAIHAGAEDQLAIRHLYERCAGQMSVDSFLDELYKYNTAAGPVVRLWGLEDFRSQLHVYLTEVPRDFGVWIALVQQVSLETLAPSKTRWCIKTPHYVFYLPLLKRLFPEARFIHLVRDGRDVVHSHLHSPLRWLMDPPNYNYGAYYWTKCNAAAASFGIQYPDNYLLVRYEDLVSKPEEICRDVCDFIGEDFEEQMLSYHKSNCKLELVSSNERAWHKKTAEPIDPNNVAKWRNSLDKRDVYEFQLVAGDMLAQYGYELVDISNRKYACQSVISKMQIFFYRVRDAYRWFFRRYFLLKNGYLFPE